MDDRGTKRGNNNGDMGGSKRRRDDGGRDIRLLIPSKAAGVLIGKGGETIKKLRQDFDCSIQVPDSNGPERMVYLHAEDSNVLNAIKRIASLLSEETRGSRGSRGGRHDDGGERCEIRFLVHQSQAGAVIGRGGATVKELRLNNKVDIKVFPEVCPHSTDRTVLMEGPSENIANCVKAILALLDESPIKGAAHNYNPNFFDPMYQADYGGYGAMGGGPMMGDRGGFMGGRRGGGDDYGMPGGRGSGYRGGDYDMAMGGRGGFGGGLQESFPGLSLGGGGYGGRRDSRGGGFDETTTTQVSIPKELAGAIIGKAGKRIQQIRRDSGANITIEEAQQGSNDRIITITGTPEQIQNAQYMLQQSVKSSKR